MGLPAEATCPDRETTSDPSLAGALVDEGVFIPDAPAAGARTNGRTRGVVS